MSNETPRRVNDALGWLHEQGKRRADAVPDFDVEETLRKVRTVRVADQIRAAGPANAQLNVMDPGHPRPANFLAALTRAELDDFMSVARERTFARGARPIREGDNPDYVMVIITGSVEISASEDGEERIIAERGSGDLVGEVGALRVNVRSATATALDTVEALVVRTADFTDFLAGHERVKAIVESQIDDRLAEEPYLLQSRAVHPPQPVLTGENCTVVLTDITGFGSRERTDRERQSIRAAHLKLVRGSLRSLWDKSIFADQGDGLLIVVPPAVPTTTIMERLHRDLPRDLRRHNRAHGDSSRLRLRVAVDVGPVMNDPVGVTGEALIRAARLLDAPVLRREMASTGGDLGVIVSTFVYETTLRHAEEREGSGQYQAVKVNVKGSRVPAWMRLTRSDPPGPPDSS